jgi:hypothetical protein
MATVVNHNDAAGFNIIDEVAHMALLTVSSRSVKHGISVARHSKLRIARFNLITLPSNPRTVERIAQRSAVKRQRSLHK